MFSRSTKVLVAALVLATSLAAAADASPRSTPGGWWSGVDTTPKERHDPTNTNGG